MNKLFCFLFLLAVTPAGSSFAISHLPSLTNDLYFIENKGQITDQHLTPRHDIQYSLHAPGFNIFIGNGQLHYQFSRLRLKHTDLPAWLMARYKAGEQIDNNEQVASVETYRMDVELVGANTNAPAITSAKLDYYENYYLNGAPREGLQAHTCRKITYKNVYTGIDWVIYIKDGHLEHEFIIGPDGNAADIKLKYSGHTSLKINSDGSISATTPMGEIKEHAPLCYSANGNNIHSSYNLKGDILSYNIDTKKNVIIDPTIIWATYYGPDSNNTSIYGMVTDNSGNIYADGLTWAPTTGNVATAGTHQATYAGNCDAFLVKFDSSGNRIWGTYYGGANGDWANDLAIDQAGNLYLLGTTNSTSGISTAGAQQVTAGGSYDAFLGRFNSAGMRIWGTYAGGTALDYPQSAACDALGHVYISGTADSYTNIATPGSHMPTHSGGHDDFLIQYDSSGVRQWGTYYGGSSDEFSGVVTAEGIYVYLAGFTYSTTGIATPGAYHSAKAGSSDVFISKFTNTGSRVWASYYGGAEGDLTGGIIADDGSVYLLGATGSDTGIATPGCYQPVRGGNQDAFVMQVRAGSGLVAWGTYFGGPGDESVDYSRLCFGQLSDIYITGFTASTTGIATSGAYHTAHGGGDQDAFFAKFSPIGTVYWSTYFGGTRTDLGKTCAFDGKNAYLAGQTSSPDSIATPGAFLTSGSSGTAYPQGFIAKFGISDIPIGSLSTGIKNTPAHNMDIYPNPNKGTFTLMANGVSNGPVALSVVDVAGRTIMSDEGTAVGGTLSKQITLPGATPAGIYYIKAISQSTTTVLRFVKE